MNYTYNDKYLLTATLRDDATSRFDKDVRWGLFPSVALGWKLNQEEFLKGFTKLSDLKLRVGYGVTGQQDITGNDYPYIATYTRSDNASRYRFGDLYYNTLRPDAYNALIKWETTATLNAGLDFGFFGNIITGSLDVYRKKSTDLISYIPPSAGTNFAGSVISNVGNIVNKGIELNLQAEIISTDALQWTVGYNITYNRNEVTQLTLSNNPNFYVPLGSVGGTTSGTIQAQKVGLSAIVVPGVSADLRCQRKTCGRRLCRPQRRSHYQHQRYVYLQEARSHGFYGYQLTRELQELGLLLSPVVLTSVTMFITT